MTDRWITETLFDSVGMRASYRATRILKETRTEHQHLTLFENPVLGKVLMLDGATQVTTADEFIYHEMMSHVPILAHGRARDVLIVGGGDCGIAKEVLKHPQVSALLQVEIDASVVEFAKAHFPEFTGPVLSDQRFELVIDDGAAFVARTGRRFDVIIIDSTDPHGPGEVLFTEEFYRGAKGCMKPGGVMVTQSGVPFLQPDVLKSSVQKLRNVFADVSCTIAAIPTYIGGHLAMGWASDDATLRKTPVDEIARRYQAAGSFATRYWTPDAHRAAFALPRYIAELAEPR
jgi:spermidine synthase